MSQWIGTLNNPINVEVLEESALAMAQSTIQNAIDEAKISKSDLARKMQIGRSGVCRILSGSHNLTIKTMARALAGCGREVRFETVPIVWNWQSIPEPSKEGLPASMGSTSCIQSDTPMHVVLPTEKTEEQWRGSWL
jgi:transcriptional regulator with XRE-family HTH domain